MSLSQIVRTNQNVGRNSNNPKGIPVDIKTGVIISKNTPPQDTEGELNDYYIDNVSGNFYGPKTNTWGAPIYNFATGTGGEGITNLLNVGITPGRVGIFQALSGGGTTANLKSLVGEPGIIDILDNTTEVFIGVDPTYKPLSLSRIENFPFQTGLGSIEFDPNGTLGEAQGYNRGSLAVQVPNVIWICQDAVTRVWSKYTDDEGVSSIQNVGAGAGAIYRDTIDGVSSLRTIVGQFEEITAATVANEVLLGISPSYKPLTLSRVENVKQGYGAASAPTAADDSGQGYIKGALYSEVEPAGAVKLWICKDAAPGAAVWGEVSGGGAVVQKDYVCWSGQGGQPQAIPNNNFTDVNFDGPAGFNVYAIAPGSKWSSINDGTRRVFRRAPVTEPKAYRFSLNMVLSSAAATVQESKYLFKMIKKTGSQQVDQSFSQAVFPISTAEPRQGVLSYSFIYYEADLTVEDYYFQVEGRLTDASTAPNVFIDNWTLSINEL